MGSHDDRTGPLRLLLRRRLGATALAAVAVALAGTALAGPSQAADDASSPGTGGSVVEPGWPMAGNNYLNSGSQPLETKIGPRNASRLRVKWTAPTHGDVSATPAVVGGYVYAPDWGGYVSKISAATGAVVWSRRISDYDGVSGAVSRTSPAVNADTVYIGDLNGAHLMAIDTADGSLRWIRQLDSHPAAILTQSPVVYNGTVYLGVSSTESTLPARQPGYPCCTFRGSMTAVDAATGAMKWKTYTVPTGYSGAAVTGGSPVVDPGSGTLYFGTGNNYSIPDGATACQTAGGTADQCLAPDDQVDAMVAVDAATGVVKWAKRINGVDGFDTWNLACQLGPGDACPANPGPDADFLSGVNLFLGAHGRILLGGGSKNGTYTALDAATGARVWAATPAPGSSFGGMMWGNATDGRRVYVAEANFAHIPYPVGGVTVTGGSWAALDPATGKVLWQTADPSAGIDWGRITAAGGVVYAGSLTGHWYALNASTGAVLYDHLFPYSSAGGASIAGGTVFVGDGYVHQAPFGTGSTTSGVLTAFTTP